MQSFTINSSVLLVVHTALFISNSSDRGASPKHEHINAHEHIPNVQLDFKLEVTELHDIQLLFCLVPDTIESFNVFKSATFEAFHSLHARFDDKVNYLSIAGVEVDAKTGTVHSINWSRRNLTRVRWGYLRRLRSLKFLYLNDNALSGPVNASAFPPSLEELWLSKNQISHFDVSSLSTALPNLRYLRLDWNRIAEALDLSALPLQLHRLDLSHNSFSGVLDFGLLRVPNSLRWADLRSNPALHYKGPHKSILKCNRGDVVSFYRVDCDWFFSAPEVDPFLCE